MIDNNQHSLRIPWLSRNMNRFDVVIIGAGLAGLQCAKLLSQRGAKILLVDRKTDLAKGVHTTGIFVRRTFTDFAFPEETLGPPVRDVSFYSPSLKVLKIASKHGEFRVGKMGKLYESLLLECVENGVRFSGATRYVSSAPAVDESPSDSIVSLEKNGAPFEVHTKVLIGADGANSRVAQDLALDANKEFIVGVEEVWNSAARNREPRLHCFLDAKLAPGYLAWIADDGEGIHIGVGGRGENFESREALEDFKAKTIGNIFALEEAELIEKRGGKIPVGGVLKTISCERGLLIGDASGAVSPLTAGGLDPCMRLSKFAAEIVAERLRLGNPKILFRYSGELFRTRFISRIWMRKLISRLTNQTALEIGCAFLRLPLFKKFAAHVFFGHGSFPDISTTKEFDRAVLEAAGKGVAHEI